MSRYDVKAPGRTNLVTRRLSRQTHLGLTGMETTCCRRCIQLSMCLPSIHYPSDQMTSQCIPAMFITAQYNCCFLTGKLNPSQDDVLPAYREERKTSFLARYPAKRVNCVFSCVIFLSRRPQGVGVWGAPAPEWWRRMHDQLCALCRDTKESLP